MATTAFTELRRRAEEGDRRSTTPATHATGVPRDLRKVLETQAKDEIPDWDVGYVDVRNVDIDRYQREVHEYKIMKILRRGWQRLHAGQIVISQRTDGGLYCIDGQHRILSILRSEGTVPYTQKVILWKGLTPDQESEIFSETQDPETRTPLLPEERHNAKVYRSDDQSTRIDQIAQDAGYHIGKRGRSEGSRRIASVNSLYDIDRDYGADMLHATLTFIAQTWGTELAPEQALLHGVARFFAMYPDIKYASLVKNCQKMSQEKFIDTFHSQGEIMAIKGKWVRMAWGLHKVYNGANKARPLPDFDETFRAFTTKRRQEMGREVRAREKALREAQS